MSILALCKFTPLGFETQNKKPKDNIPDCVNLPRWGLKLVSVRFDLDFFAGCKFTPLGFETLLARYRRPRLPV